MNRTAVKKAREDLERVIQKKMASEQAAWETYEGVRHLPRDGAYVVRRNKARETLERATYERRQVHELHSLLAQIENLLGEHEELYAQLPPGEVSLTETRLELLVYEDLAKRCAPAEAKDRPSKRRLQAAIAEINTRAHTARANYEAALSAEVLQLQMMAIDKEARKLADQAVRLDKGLRKVFK